MADYVDARLNPVVGPGPGPVSTSHASLHDRLFVADLHADTLMWRRDLLERGRWGHVDVPRLRQGGINLQVFTVVTQTPPERHSHAPGIENEHCVSSSSTNMTGLLSVVQGRPLETWGNLRSRALYQARRLDEAVLRSLRSGETELLPVRHVDDLRRLVRLHAEGRDVLGAVLGLEGANWIGGAEFSEAQVRAEVRALYNAGFRTFALTHRFDNSLSGSSEGCDRYGLTPQGAAALDEAQDLGMVIDLAHVSSRSLQDILRLRLLRRPPIVSHTGVQASCTGPCHRGRNLADDELVAIARLGGVIGIGFWPEAVGSGGTSAILASFARAAAVLTSAGLSPWRHLAFGSDYDGAVEVPFDATGMPGLTQALVQGAGGTAAAMPPEALPLVAGANVCRVMALSLPGGGMQAAEDICLRLR
ncbi:membrane dipeptidase [Roseomonas sp. ROY-5-3]|uniref:Membrane dipeptidase n=1 Tax=Falsiroseomonas oleicola TaxID=2801474 RepID=A0ABS6HEN8_9PROT|nr:membrane dipeptidase [Roseomonas oleicola]